MKMKQINEALKKAIEMGIKPMESKHHLKPNSHEAKFIDEYQVITNQKVRKLVLDSLMKESKIAMYDEGWFIIGNAATQIKIRDIAEWLLAQSLKSGNPKIPLKRLYDILESNQVEACIITVLDGIQIESKYRLSDKFSLIPFEEIQETLPKAVFLDLFEEISPGSFSKKPKPRVALKTKLTIQPHLMTESEERASKSGVLSQPTDFRKIRLEIQNILNCISVYSSTIPFNLAQWIEIEKPIIYPTYCGMTLSSRNDIPIYTDKNLTKTNIGDLIDILRGFLRLETEVKDYLVTPLHWLAKARKHHDQINRALELAIAIETLLATDRSDDAPIGFIIRQRGVYLSKGIDMSHKEIKKLLKDIYKLRSKIVHAGSGSLKNKTYKQQSELLSQGILLCSFILRKLIEKNKKPDWDSLVLCSKR